MWPDVVKEHFSSSYLLFLPPFTAQLHVLPSRTVILWNTVTYLTFVAPAALKSQWKVNSNPTFNLIFNKQTALCTTHNIHPIPNQYYTPIRTSFNINHISVRENCLVCIEAHLHLCIIHHKTLFILFLHPLCSLYNGPQRAARLCLVIWSVWPPFTPSPLPITVFLAETRWSKIFSS